MNMPVTAPLGRDPETIRVALRAVAELVCEEPQYAPIFTRLEAELEAAEAALSADPMERARAIARQMARR